MANEKITLTLNDLNSPQVEGRLKQQEAVTAAQAKFQEQTPSQLDVSRKTREASSLWFSSAFNMAFFGMIGGLLAWGCGELKYLFNPDQQKEARALVAEMGQITKAVGAKAMTLDQAVDVVQEIEQRGSHNPYFRVLTDATKTNEESHVAYAALEQHDRIKDLIANMLYYGACGMMIAMALGVAEPVSARNYSGAVTNGAVGVVLGLLGGVIVSLLADPLYHALGGGQMGQEVSLGREMFANTVKWGVLGLFLSAAPGLVMRNTKRLIVGLIGGLIGGLLGGALFDPVAQLTRGHFSHEDTISRLVAMVAIGLVAGAGTGLIENAAKAGWMKVMSGLIAGKQFILYRNPTFIGSAPQCQIYLFKDAKVGRRHAAIHISPGGYYIEDLGSGAQTLVNGRAVARVRLKHGDQVQVGSTTFAFREKTKHV